MGREAMNFVWCEWICTRCGELHKVRFKIVAKKRNGLLLKDCIVEDYPLDQENSTIHAKWDMKFSDVFSALRSHMLEFYAVQEDSLTMDLNRE
jgi:hypothetical protein